MNNVELVRNFIVECFLFGNDKADFDEDTSLLENGIIDSTGVLELVQFIEETFKIKIEDEELLPENLDTLNNIADFLERKTKEL